MKKAVIFDMDGLMVNSSPVWAEAETTFVKKYGKEYSHEIRKKYLGMRVKDIIMIMVKEYQLPISFEEGEKELLAEMKIDFNRTSVKLLPGCRKLIRNLSKSVKYCLAVASSSPKDIIETVLQRFRFEDVFQVVVSSEEVEHGKPAPDVFLRASKLLKIKPQFCLVLEDAPHGIAAAKAAGMKSIAVNNTSNYQLEDFKNADLYVRSLEEINEEVIERIFQ